MGGKVLIDTSIWIEYFNRAQSPLHAEVARLLRDRATVYTGIIALELIRGVRTEKEKSTLDSLLQSIDHVTEGDSTHCEAGRMGNRLARKGFTLGTVDLLIGQLAIENDVLLFTRDQHFATLAKHESLRLYKKGDS